MLEYLWKMFLTDSILSIVLFYSIHNAYTLCSRGQNTFYGYEGYFKQILAKIAWARSSFYHRPIFTCGGYFVNRP